MLISGGFVAACLQTIAKEGSSILGRPGQTRAMSRASTTRRPVHTLTTVEGLRPSFRHGLHGAVGMIFYAHVVYVVICYMSIICYMSVICLVQSPPQEAVVVFGYIEGPFLRICVINHASVKVVVEPRSQLCALLEVWVLGVGMSTLGRKPNVDDHNFCFPLRLSRYIIIDHTSHTLSKKLQDVNPRTRETGAPKS
jgi:hypothetical protein